MNDDCLLLLPKTNEHADISMLVIAAATLRAERWRFSYGRKLTPERIAGFSLPTSDTLRTWVQTKLTEMLTVVEASLSPYSRDDRDSTTWYDRGANCD